MSLIRVDVAKPTQGTTVSPQSPQVSNVQSPKTNFKGMALAGYGALVAQQTYNVVVNEIKAGGNERLATTIGNITSPYLKIEGGLMKHEAQTHMVLILLLLYSIFQFPI